MMRIRANTAINVSTNVLHGHRRAFAGRYQHEKALEGRYRVFSGDGVGEEDLEAQVEAFMQKQAEVESGQSTRAVDPNKILGEDQVSEEDAKAYCREIVQVMKTLKQNRDMTVNEIKLTISIEDPRAREQRLMGIEDSRGVSRDEMAAALEVVAEGQVPRDRIALRELHREMVNWPFLEVDGTKTTGIESLAPPTTPASDDASAPWRREQEARPPMGRDPNEQPSGLTDLLPDWVGYGALYLVSIAPVLIALSVVAILFFNSLR
ncbi:hypothetical protein M9434_001657 [Picochlorum sp. BPE23]|nr:hypothetical protein M9434_001657 [Picochlorum sp. BPE23]KAI8110373.1 hypothetical protein M9435_002048 [Picochlorum sp. BPE23]